MLDLSPLDRVSRLLMTVPLRPVQGDRFQPTGFPSLGAATYQTREGPKLLVESAQSMANRLETTCWDAATNNPVAALNGISHVTVTRGKDNDQKPKFLTDSMLEAHRLNSVYIERSQGEFFTKTLPESIGASKDNPLDRKQFVEALLKYDVGSLIHGVFLESIDGRLRIARALSAFIEASGIQVAASGGVKNDRVKATKEEGKTSKEGFGNIPFARDEYVAETINLYINLDLAQIRGYGLGDKVERLLILLALFKVRKLIDGDLRLRTACDLTADPTAKISIAPEKFSLPRLDDLVGIDSDEGELRKAIKACKNEKDESLMVHTAVTFEDELKKAKDEKKPKRDDADDSGDDEDNDTESDDN